MVIKLKSRQTISSLTFGQARVRGITKKRWLHANAIKRGIARARRRKIIYFTNFNIIEGHGYLNGSLSSNKDIPLKEAKQIIKDNLPLKYTPKKFIQAEEQGEQNFTLLVVFMGEEEIIEVFLDV